jgi:hypothetical protein
MADASDNPDPQYPLRGSVVRYDDPYGSAFPIDPEVVRIDGTFIVDWNTFHQVCAETFGFPSFYGMNMNAWIDCMSDFRTDSKMSNFLLQSGQVLQIELSNEMAAMVFVLL